MKDFKSGTPAFGIVMGILFAVIGLLLITLGFWKTLLLCALFGAGYFLGAVNNKEDVIKSTVNRIIPDKKAETIDFRKTVSREQEEALKNSSESAAETEASRAQRAESSEAAAMGFKYVSDVEINNEAEPAGNVNNIDTESTGLEG